MKMEKWKLNRNVSYKHEGAWVRGQDAVLYIMNLLCWRMTGRPTAESIMGNSRHETNFAAPKKRQLTSVLGRAWPCFDSEISGHTQPISVPILTHCLAVWFILLNPLPGIITGWMLSFDVVCLVWDCLFCHETRGRSTSTMPGAAEVSEAKCHWPHFSGCSGSSVVCAVHRWADSPCPQCVLVHVRLHNGHSVPHLQLAIHCFSSVNQK